MLLLQGFPYLEEELISKHMVHRYVHALSNGVNDLAESPRHQEHSLPLRLQQRYQLRDAWTQQGEKTQLLLLQSTTIVWALI